MRNGFKKWLCKRSWGKSMFEVNLTLVFLSKVNLIEVILPLHDRKSLILITKMWTRVQYKRSKKTTLEAYWVHNKLSQCLHAGRSQLKNSVLLGHNWESQCCKFITFRLKILALLEFWSLPSRMNFPAFFFYQIQTVLIKAGLQYEIYTESSQ